LVKLLIVNTELKSEWKEGKAKLAQQKLRENHLPQLTGNQNQRRVNWAAPAPTASGRLRLYFIVAINFLPFTLSR